VGAVIVFVRWITAFPSCSALLQFKLLGMILFLVAHGSRFRRKTICNTKKADVNRNPQRRNEDPLLLLLLLMVGIEY
jgi:hypothetical protein